MKRLFCEFRIGKESRGYDREIDLSRLHRGSMQKVDVVTTEPDAPVPLYYSRKAVLDE
jgi:hypothetical protein